MTYRRGWFPVPMLNVGVGTDAGAGVPEEWKWATPEWRNERPEGWFITHFKNTCSKLKVGPQPKPQACALGGQEPYDGDWVWINVYIAAHKDVYEELIGEVND